MLTQGCVDTELLPVQRSARKGKKRGRTTIDGAKFRARMRALCAWGPVLVAVEQVNGRPRDGASRAFSFGFTVGRLVEACEAAGAVVVFVPVAVWRAKLGVHAHARQTGDDTKTASRFVASAMFSADTTQWEAASHDGRAEAALIAAYAAKYCV